MSPGDDSAAQTPKRNRRILVGSTSWQDQQSESATNWLFWMTKILLYEDLNGDDDVGTECEEAGSP